MSSKNKLYPVKLFFRTEGEIKTFPDKQKLKEFNITSHASQEKLKGAHPAEMKEHKLVT